MQVTPTATESLVPVKIGSVSGASHLSWAEGMQFCLPQSILEKSQLNEDIDKDGNLVIPSEIPRVSAQAAEALRLRAAFTNKRPFSSRLPFSYQNVPPRLRCLAASIIGRYRCRCPDRWAAFPRWPLDLSADLLADLANGIPSPFAKGPTPVLLTHDLDSAEGLKNLVSWFLDIEESVGVRSTNFIVPRAWPIDYTLLDHVSDRGHEIGIHGYDHSNITPFLDPIRRRDRLEGARELIDRYDILGYRSPSLLRTRDLLRDLGNLYRYDSSVPTSGGLFPVPNNGCASARPFWIEEIAELPLTMPRDGSLRFLGYSPQETLDCWIHCAQEISQSGGMVVLLTHCEVHFSGNSVMREVYRRFLDYIASSELFAWSNPQESLKRFMGIEFHG